MKKIVSFHSKLTKRYAFELTLLNRTRRFADGITFFDLNVNLDLYKMSHNPKIIVSLTIFNVTLFEFSIYNVNHYESEF